MKATKTTRTASSAYRENLRDVKTLIERLQIAVVIHSYKQSRNANNWGYVGDVADVRANLIMLVASMTGVEESNVRESLSDSDTYEEHIIAAVPDTK